MKLRRIVPSMIALLLVCSLPVTALAAEYDLAEGSVTVIATESGQTVTHGSNAAVPDDAPVIVQSNSETPTTNTVTVKAEENAAANVIIQGVNIANSDPSGSPQNHSDQAAVTIDVADGASANVTLDGVKIDVGGTGNIWGNDPGEAAVQITGNGDVTLELDGTNTVRSGSGRAGVEKNTIAATGTDLGSGNGNLTITDENETAGSLESTGGLGGAGIGGGHDRSGSNITITGNAEVTAQGGLSASGIGGGAYHNGSNINISGGKVTATGGDLGAGIGGGLKGSGSEITISGGTVEATGGENDGSGIGGGAFGSGSEITISGTAEVTAKGGNYGSGIGGGFRGKGSNITISQDAQVKAQGGKDGKSDYNSEVLYGAGAAIGNGGKSGYSYSGNLNGAEATPNTNALNEGWIATYTPATTDLDTVPDSLTYRDDSGTVITEKESQKIEIEEAVSATCTEDGHEAGFSVGGALVAVTIPAKGHSFTNYISNPDATYDHDGTKTARCDFCDATDTIPDPGSKLVWATAPLYRVVDPDGKTLDYKAERKDGVLTITAEADSAALTGTLGGIRTLKAQGIDTIVFVTNGATSTFALSDLLAQGGDGYTLTHDGAAVTFTMTDGADVSKILQ